MVLVWLTTLSLWLYSLMCSVSETRGRWGSSLWQMCNYLSMRAVIAAKPVAPSWGLITAAATPRRRDWPQSSLHALRRHLWPRARLRLRAGHEEKAEKPVPDDLRADLRAGLQHQALAVRRLARSVPLHELLRRAVRVPGLGPQPQDAEERDGRRGRAHDQAQGRLRLRPPSWPRHRLLRHGSTAGVLVVEQAHVVAARQEGPVVAARRRRQLTGGEPATAGRPFRAGSWRSGSR